MKKSGKTELKWEDLPRETREITSFFHLVIQETIESMNVEFIPTYIRCFKKNCHGIIETSMHENMEDICWKCIKNNNNINILSFQKWLLPFQIIYRHEKSFDRLCGLVTIQLEKDKIKC